MRDVFRLTASTVAVLALLLAPSCAFANDSFVEGVGGRVVQMMKEHRAIRMVRERVRLDLYDRYYDTTAEFLFRNETPRAVTVRMGFPETGYIDGEGREMRSRSGFRSFSTSVDGHIVAAKRLLTRAGPDGNYAAFWVKTVTFAPNARRHVIVHYRSPYGGVSSGELTTYVIYHFTGGNWRGTVAESRMDIVFHAPGTFAAVGTLYARHAREHPVAFQQSGTALHAAWHDWQAEADFSLAFDRTVHGALVPARPTEYPVSAAMGRPRSDLVYVISVPGRRKNRDVRSRRIYFPLALERNGAIYARESRAEFLLYPDRRDPNAGSLNDNHPAMVGGKPVTSAAGTIDIAGGLDGHETERYVPLQPIVKALGGKMSVDSRSHRITVLVPQDSAVRTQRSRRP